MRFNSRELAQIAQQAASVDKEGVLYMKERQDSIFKRQEGMFCVLCALSESELFIM